MSGEQRIDQWLYVARFFKSRSIAAKMVRLGRIRMAGKQLRKPAHGVRVEDVLTVARAHEVVVVRVLGFAPRRLPAAKARELYEVLAREEHPRPHPAPAPPARPDKRSRRRLAALKVHR